MTDGKICTSHQASPQATPDVIASYASAAEAIRRSLAKPDSSLPAARLEARMRAVVDAAWEHLSPTGVSWVGFYLPVADEESGSVTELVLGPSRNKPACSPIGLHGVCGQAYLGETIRIVRDVAELGPNYVACDPRDASELVLPVDDLAAPASSRCFGVLDLDSHAIGRFTEADAEAMTNLLHAAGFGVRGLAPAPPAR